MNKVNWFQNSILDIDCNSDDNRQSKDFIIGIQNN